MAKIEKRCTIRIFIDKRACPDIKPMFTFGIGVNIPIRWMDKNNVEIIRKLPIVDIDISDKSKPVFVLDASTKYHSKLIQLSFNYILECCFDYVDDIPEMSDYKLLIDSIKVDEYVAIVHNGYEYVLDDIVKVTDRDMASQIGRICEINEEGSTFTIDTSEDANSSSWIYSIVEVFSIGSV